MPGRKVELQPAQPRPEVRHAREAAVTEYPLRATRLVLSALSAKEQEEIHRLVNDPKKTYVSIGRDVHLSAPNWAVVKRENGFEIWQAQIHSPAALSLKVRFRNFDLGPGMAVKVYGLSAAVSAPVAEYTGHGLGDEGKFWSLRVPGDTVVVEHWVPVDREMRPDDFPFKVERISHGFRDIEGKLSGVGLKQFEPRSYGSCGPGEAVCDSRVGAAVARYTITPDSGRGAQCSGALLNNATEDGALFFLTAFHCIEEVVSSSEAFQGTFINTDFQFRYCGQGGYIRGSGAGFIAGSEASVADWALLRIEGELTGVDYSGNYYLLGSNPGNLDTFEGYTIHHGSGQPQTRSSFRSEGLLSVNWTADSFTFPASCSGVDCSHFAIELNEEITGGASGAPIFVNRRSEVVGVATGRGLDCSATASRFSKMYQDGRVRGALTYGDDYLFARGAAASFDDSARPDYNVVAPEIEDGAEKMLSVVYGHRSGMLTLRADAVDTNSLRWQLLPGSGASVPGSTVRFLRDGGAEARVVYEVLGGIEQRDQFSVQVSSAGGNDVVTVFVVPLRQSLPAECVGKGLATAGGDGTRTNPYQLGTLCQLQDMDSQRSAHYRLVADIDASASRDWNGGRGFVPVGQNLEFSQVFELDSDRGLVLRSDLDASLSRDAFSGSLDGGGFSVIGLVVNRRAEDFAGLFSITSKAEFKNVQLLNTVIKGRRGAGVLAGVMVGGTVSGFYFKGAVDGHSYVGGLSGINFSGTLEDGLAAGSVQGAGDYVGGLVGSNHQGTIRFVYLHNSLVSGKNVIGGLAGNHHMGNGQDSIIANSYAAGSVSGAVAVGGLVGWTRGGRIGESYATGSVVGSGEVVGGLVGWSQDGNIVESYATGMVSGSAAVGGFAGWNYLGRISNGFATGRVNGSDVAGGFVGLNLYGDIDDSYATGSVSGIQDVGGLAGWNYEGDIGNSYATGSVSGNSWVGSLVGDNWGRVVNSYASGEVLDRGNGRWAGGLLGDNSEGSSSGSFLRTLSQLRCPTGPGQNCLGATTYVDWSERDWYFGNGNTLPAIQSLQVAPVFLAPPVIRDGHEKTSRVLYGVESVALTLAATAVDAATLEWQLLPGSGPGVAGSGVNFSDDEGAQARVVYLLPGGIQEKDRFSVQVRGLGGSDVVTILIEPYSPPEIIADEGLTIAIHARATESSPLELRALDRDGSAGELEWLVDKSGLAAGSDVSLLVRSEGDESVATLIFARPQNSMLAGTFTVQVTDAGGLQDSVDIAVATIPNRPPVIMGENPRFLSIFEGKTSTSLELLANDPDPGETVDLQWLVQPMAGSNPGDSRLNFRLGGDQIFGPRAEVFFSRTEGSVAGGEFIVSVMDFLDAVSTVRVIIHHIANTSPVISQVFGRAVNDVEELTVYISPQVREVTLRAIAFDEFPETLKWTISDTPVSATTARFVSGDEAESSTQVSGVGEVRVLYQRDPATVSSSRFVVAVADGLGKSDQLAVSMVEDESSPRIVNEGVKITMAGKTLEVEIPYGSERLMLDLFTSSPRAGLVGELVSSSPPGTAASFPQSFGGGQVRVELRVPRSLDAASFTIGVANGNAAGAASEKIIILVSRQKFIRARLKMLLGGAVR